MLKIRNGILLRILETRGKREYASGIDLGDNCFISADNVDFTTGNKF